MTLRCRPKGRTAVHPTTIPGQDARPGDVVVTLLGAANPGPDAVANPDALDLARRGRPVLAFGAVVRLCLGGPLARRKGVKSVPASAVSVSTPTIHGGTRVAKRINLRGLTALPLDTRGGGDDEDSDSLPA